MVATRWKMAMAAVALVALPGCVTIQPGNVGVVTDTVSGKVAPKPLTAGYHMVGFFKNIFEYPSGVVDSINLDNLRVNTKEGQEITIDLRVQYRPELTENDDKAVQLYNRYRKPFEGDHGLVATRWIPVIQQATGYAVSQFGVIEMYQSRGAKAAGLVQRVLQDGLRNRDVTIDGIGDDFVSIQMVAISDITLPEAIKRAVEKKAEIEQQTLTAKQALETSRMEAQKKLIEARAEADAKLIQAKGEASARAALGISPEQYTRLEVARMTTQAIKEAPNLMILPPNAILDTRALAGLGGGAAGPKPGGR